MRIEIVLEGNLARVVESSKLPKYSRLDEKKIVFEHDDINALRNSLLSFFSTAEAYLNTKQEIDAQWKKKQRPKHNTC